MQSWIYEVICSRSWCTKSVNWSNFELNFTCTFKIRLIIIGFVRWLLTAYTSWNEESSVFNRIDWMTVFLPNVKVKASSIQWLWMIIMKNIQLNVIYSEELAWFWYVCLTSSVYIAWHLPFCWMSSAMSCDSALQECIKLRGSICFSKCG